ncbi:DUF916 and DUF3324 domain-containing protein (plasmid) [Enterococcus faecalis]|uniref:DUF916 and DUF3324 domain-containing protein n=1 Tax=Enterococcus faecalis TaxID=1351 RepID=UPI0024ADF531|nr:DUF916 and DUF3324 domain-containing protein [Enterococcus faecalis]WHK76547.1 DUF916 and DUF3324 domain-containing protein [Enterococcus faecalis]
MERNKKNIFHFGLSIFPLIIIFFGVDVFANSSDLDYSIQPIFPPNQQDNHVAYYDLFARPGESQDIKFQLFNDSDDKREFKVEVNDADTSDGGTIVYYNNDAKLLSSPKFTDMVLEDSKKQKIVVEGHSSKVVYVNIQYPSEKIMGTILGGFHIYEIGTKKEHINQTGINIKNKFSYSLGVKIQESKEEVIPELEIGEVKLNAKNYHPVLSVELRNNARAIASDLDIDFLISDSKNSEVKKYSINKGKMAPISNMYVRIPVELRQLKPGKYTLIGQATSTAGQWEWKKEFIVSKENVKNIKNNTVKYFEFSKYIYLIMMLEILLVTLTIVWIVKNRRKK